MKAQLPRQKLQPPLSAATIRKGALALAAKKVQAAGRGDDKLLVHINPDEFERMKRAFGPPRINPKTGLAEFGWLGKILKKAAPMAAFFIPGLGPVATALTAAAIGGGVAAASGDNVLKGAITGGLTGATPGITNALGAGGSILGSAAVGAGTGAAGAALTGGNIGQGALYGAAGGALSGASTSPSAGGATGTTPGQAASTSQAAIPGGLEEIVVRGNPITSGAQLAGNVAAGAGTALAANQAPTAPMEEITIQGQAPTAPTLPGNLLAGGGVSLGGAPPQAPQPGSNTPPLSADMESIDVTAPRAPASAAAFSPGSAFGTAATLGLAGNTSSPGPARASDSDVGDDEEEGGLWNWIKKNPAVGVGGALLAYQGMAGQGRTPQTSGGAPPPGLTDKLNNISQDLLSRGNALQNYMNTGTLPPGAKASLDIATRSAKATLKSRFAAMGMSNSTSEASALAQVEMQAAGQAFEIAHDLYQTGLKQSTMSAEIYRSLLGYAQNQDTRADNENTRLDNAIVNFAVALAGASA